MIISRSYVYTQNHSYCRAGRHGDAYGPGYSLSYNMTMFLGGHHCNWTRQFTSFIGATYKTHYTLPG